MPYRSLTHGRVGGGRTGYNRFESLPSSVSKSQVSAINSAKGVENSGPTIKNNATSGSSQKARRTISNNFLMLANAYGSGKYVYGQGKGFPRANPQISVGSTNTFARRAIARRAVTNVNTKIVSGNNGEASVCECVSNPVRNSKGEVINKA
tara:strand:- start:2717 stop:3169 length:453 start_codon:yes stop_codon:yes gene_type:complete